MDTEEKRKIDRTLALAEENNRLIKKMIRQMRWGRLIRVAYWIVIISASVGLFYWLQPYIEDLQSAYVGANEAVDDIGNFFSN